MHTLLCCGFCLGLVVASLAANGASDLKGDAKPCGADCATSGTKGNTLLQMHSLKQRQEILPSRFDDDDIYPKPESHLGAFFEDYAQDADSRPTAALRQDGSDVPDVGKLGEKVESLDKAVDKLSTRMDTLAGEVHSITKVTDEVASDGDSPALASNEADTSTGNGDGNEIRITKETQTSTTTQAMTMPTTM